jgi:hypothetical protein
MSKLLSKSGLAIFLTSCVLIFGACSGVAQVDTGTILGTVKDQTGAVIPDARVTITNQGTSEQFTTTTRDDGTYKVTPLKIGTYRISVEHAGFNTAENAAFELNIQQQAVVGFYVDRQIDEPNRAGHFASRATADAKRRCGPGDRRNYGREHAA